MVWPVPTTNTRVNYALVKKTCVSHVAECGPHLHPYPHSFFTRTYHDFYVLFNSPVVFLPPFIHRPKANTWRYDQLLDGCRGFWDPFKRFVFQRSNFLETNRVAVDASEMQTLNLTLWIKCGLWKRHVLSRDESNDKVLHYCMISLLELIALLGLFGFRVWPYQIIIMLALCAYLLCIRCAFFFFFPSIGEFLHPDLRRKAG